MPQNARVALIENSATELNFFFDKTHPITHNQYPKSDIIAFISTGLAFGRSLRLGRRVFMMRFAVTRRPRSMNAAALRQHVKLSVRKEHDIAYLTPHA